MKKQIRRFSPHQNAKVFAVLMAVSIIPFMIPTLVFMSSTLPDVDQNGNPVAFPFKIFLWMPIFYLIFGYLSVAVGCFIYNFIYKYVGGIEVEVIEKDNP